MQNIRALFAFFGLLTLSFALPAHAGGGEKDHKNKSNWFAGVFVGATDSDYGTEATYGLEAFYKASDRIKVGLVWEHLPDVGNGYEANLVIGEVSVEVFDHFRVIGGAGKEYHKGHEVGLWRTGVAYDFYLPNKFVVSPTIAVDWFEDTETTVAGVVIGRKF